MLGDTVPSAILRLARSARRVTVLTGAGMSAESGVPTFRDARTGLWSRLAAEDLATPQAWRRDRSRVNAWYLSRVHLVRSAVPHAGHRALAAWAARPGVELRIITQNIDDLHERAGSDVLAHLHGSLFSWRCDECSAPAPTPRTRAEPAERADPDQCARCRGGVIRPGVVWFGEALPQEPFDAAIDACRNADLVLVIGTSGIVYPAAELPRTASESGIPVVDVDPSDTALTAVADHVWRSTAAEALPAVVAALTRT